jgi:hypothetical protein
MATAGSYGYRLESGGKLEIEGLKEVQRDLYKLGKASRDEMKETHRKAGEIVIDGARRFVPVVSGNLLNSLKSVPTQRQGRVRIGSASVPYAGAIHFGWPARRIKPQPFIYDSLDGRRTEVAKIYAERIGELITTYQLAPGQRPTTSK